MAIHAYNLVYLAYAPNPTVTLVVGVKPAGVEVNLKNGTWCCNGDKPRPIGTPKKYSWGDNSRQGGIIGVYDRTNIFHLNAMNTASYEAVRPYQNENVLED